jgi:hypothetical protein
MVKMIMSRNMGLLEKVRMHRVRKSGNKTLRMNREPGYKGD